MNGAYVQEAVNLFLERLDRIAEAIEALAVEEEEE